MNQKKSLTKRVGNQAMKVKTNLEVRRNQGVRTNQATKMKANQATSQTRKLKTTMKIKGRTLARVLYRLDRLVKVKIQKSRK